MCHYTEGDSWSCLHLFHIHILGYSLEIYARALFTIQIPEFVSGHLTLLWWELILVYSSFPNSLIRVCFMSYMNLFMKLHFFQFSKQWKAAYLCSIYKVYSWTNKLRIVSGFPSKPRSSRMAREEVTGSIPRIYIFKIYIKM